MPERNSKHSSGKDMFMLERQRCTKMNMSKMFMFARLCSRISGFPVSIRITPTSTMPRQCPRPQEAPILAASSGGINLTRSIHGTMQLNATQCLHKDFRKTLQRLRKLHTTSADVATWWKLAETCAYHILHFCLEVDSDFAVDSDF